jgi:uncharacterized protein
MKVSGTHELGAGRDQVWEALQDPAVLVRTLPGCEALERTAPDRYAVTVKAGVASIRGTYSGTVGLADQDPPNAYTLVASGQGGPGTVDATARVTLADTSAGGTLVSYDADAVVGGMVGGVGQRVLTTVARSMAGEFFVNVDEHLRTGGLAPAPAAPAGPAPAEAQAVGEVFRAPPRPAPAVDLRALALAAFAGALIALLGVLVGRRSAGRAAPPPAPERR